MRLFFTSLMFVNSLFLISSTPIKNASDKHIHNLDSTRTFTAQHELISKEVFTYTPTNQIRLKTEGFEWLANKWTKTYEADFGYDSNQNKISEFGTSWDVASNSFKPAYKYAWAYDALGNYKNEEYFTKDATDADFVGQTKTVYSYNPDGSIADVTSYIWGQGSIWIENEKYVYGYDSNGNQISQQIYARNSSTSDWEKKLMYAKVFDSSKNLLSEEYYKGNEEKNEWTKASKLTYTYTGGKLTTKLVEVGNTSNQWEDSQKYTYSYTGADIASIQESTWANAQWVDHSKDVYTYTSGQLNKIESSLWNASTSKWSIYFEKQYTQNSTGVIEESYSFDYKGQKFGIKKSASKEDANNNRLLQESSAWGNGKWELLSKEESLFDPNSNVISYAKYNSKGGYYKGDFTYTDNTRPLLNTVYTWDKTQSRWNEDQYTKYYYRDIVSINEVDNDKQIQIWSSINKITIESEQPIKLVNVYSMQGKQVYNGRESEIMTSDWAKSAYIVTVVTEDGIRKSAKVIVQ